MYAPAILLFAAVGLVRGIPFDVDSESSRIIGGQDATEGDYPYQVSLRSISNRLICSGSILTNRTILTAAHCLRGRTPGSVIVVAGTNRIDTTSGVFLNTLNFTIHPNYTNEDFENDIAVLYLDSEVEYSDLVRPIYLGLDEVGAGANVTLSGWGSTSYPGNPSNTLQQINLRTLSVNNCVDQVGNAGTVFNSSLCTLTRAGEGACAGDNGGPLVRNGELVGVLSWASPCARGIPDLFTRISSFIEWIDENTW